jgi:hypothetical protein
MLMMMLTMLLMGLTMDLMRVVGAGDVLILERTFALARLERRVEDCSLCSPSLFFSSLEKELAYHVSRVET